MTTLFAKRCERLKEVGTNFYITTFDLIKISNESKLITLRRQCSLNGRYLFAEIYDLESMATQWSERYGTLAVHKSVWMYRNRLNICSFFLCLDVKSSRLPYLNLKCVLSMSTLKFLCGSQSCAQSVIHLVHWGSWVSTAYPQSCPLAGAILTLFSLAGTCFVSAMAWINQISAFHSVSSLGKDDFMAAL